MILGGLAYLHIQEECLLYKTHQSPRTFCRLYLTLRASVSKHIPKSQLQYRISFPRLTYNNREDLDYTPHRSTSTPSESIRFWIFPRTHHSPGAIIIVKMVLWKDTVPLLITNNCADTIWPGIYTTSGTGPGTGGFELAAGANKSFEVGSDWYGRIWGRTNCTSPSDGVLTCTTGSCGQMDCTQASVSRNISRPSASSTTNTTFRATHQPH